MHGLRILCFTALVFFFTPHGAHGPYGVLAASFTYTLTGQTHILAGENAVDSFLIDSSAELLVNEDGAVFGEGTLTYLQMNRCAWAPPMPEGQSGYCRTQGVTDATFTIEGEVLEYVHRHDDENPLKEALFQFSEPLANKRPDYVPAVLSLHVLPVGALEEHMAFWGFSGGGIQERTLGAAMLGMYASTLFDHAFTLHVLDAFDAKQTMLLDAAAYDFFGSYQGGTPVFAQGRIGLTAFPRDLLPSVTDPWTYLGHWVSGPGEEPIGPSDLDALYAEEQHSQSDGDDLLDPDMDVSQPDSRDGLRDEIRNLQSWVTVEAIRQQHGLPPAQPWTYQPPSGHPYQSSP